MNGVTNDGWSQKEEMKDGPPGPEICWNNTGSVQPLGFIDMSEEEQAVRSISLLWTSYIGLTAVPGLHNFGQLPYQSPYASR